MLPRSVSPALVFCALVLAGALTAAQPALYAATPDGGPSATEIMTHAEAQARAEHKNILLDFGASWCGNCKLYDRFLADPQMHALLSRVFVFASMTTGEHDSDTKHANTPGGLDFEASIGGKGAGWPYLIMLDADGRPIVDSFRPDPASKSGKSNTGYPDATEEVDWFVEMLRRAAPSLSAQELASVHAWLTAHSTTQHHKGRPDQAAGIPSTAKAGQHRCTCGGIEIPSFQNALPQWLLRRLPPRACARPQSRAATIYPMSAVTPFTDSIQSLRSALAAGETTPTSLAQQALARSNRNASHNTYLWQDAAWTRSEATRVEAMPRGHGGPFGDGRSPLWGVLVSVKDCFDLAGSPTTCGAHFYRDLHGIATQDSWLVERLRSAGAVITGKTHLHPLAYGITGENPDYGDCLQPSDPTALTGGSSSGAAASVQEGSAVFAIGTDTGGSIRTPAALCGLAGYRASIGLTSTERGDWRGGAHLAQSFDTMGGLFRNLEDAPLLASLFAVADDQPAPRAAFTRFAAVDDSFLHDCDPRIVSCLHSCARELETLGLRGTRIDTSWWADAYEIFAPIQAFEAARIHAGHLDRIEPSIRERLEWGASIGTEELASLRQRHQAFRARMDDLFAAHELVLIPASPLARLDAGADHSQTRPRILRYTTPLSLSGTPVVTIPCAAGGMQLGAARGCDEALLQLAARLGTLRKSNNPPPAA